MQCRFSDSHLRYKSEGRAGTNAQNSPQLAGNVQPTGRRTHGRQLPAGPVRMAHRPPPACPKAPGPGIEHPARECIRGCPGKGVGISVPTGARGTPGLPGITAAHKHHTQAQAHLSWPRAWHSGYSTAALVLQACRGGIKPPPPDAQLRSNGGGGGCGDCALLPDIVKAESRVTQDLLPTTCSRSVCHSARGQKGLQMSF